MSKKSIVTEAVKRKIHKIIKDGYYRNVKSIPWTGMHDNEVKTIIDLIDKITGVKQ